MFRQLCLKFIIERIAGFLIPKEVILGECLGVGNGRSLIKATVSINGEPLARPQFPEHSVDATLVFLKRDPADFHLHDGAAAVEIAAHLLPKTIQTLRGCLKSLKPMRDG